MAEREYERDYIDRTIQTVRNHRDADNCWPQWANIFADEIERLRGVLEAAESTAEIVVTENERLRALLDEFEAPLFP